MVFWYSDVMRKIIKTGLTIGKFAPFHKGHQFLIETALREMDKMLVMVYDCPEITNVPLKVRANWIKRLYPRADVIEAWNSPKEIGRTSSAIKAQVDYILSKVHVPITHFYSSEWYGEYVSKAFNAKNVLVDVDRKNFPVSGALLRSDPRKYKDFLDPLVYEDVILYQRT